MTQTTLSSSPLKGRPWWGGLGAGRLVALEAALLAAVTAYWAAAAILGGQAPAEWAVAVSAAALVAILATLLCLDGVRAMALQTFAQCVRMKVALVTMVMMAAVLATLPYIMTGDRTLAGAIRSLLAYGVSYIAATLCVLTVLLSTYVVSSDVQHKQVFLTATKPLDRWQYVVGRWLGILMLDALLLVLAMGALYALAQHLRRQPVPETLAGEDRRIVESEVFTARGRVHPDPVNLEDRIRERIRRSIEQQGGLDAIIESWLPRVGGGDRPAAEQAFYDDIRKQVAGDRFSAGPGGMMSWAFSGIRAAGAEATLPGVIEEVRDGNAALIRVDPDRSGAILFGAPLHVEDVDARVVRADPNFIVVLFDPGGLARLGLDPVGRDVTLTLDPTIQLTYKASTTGQLPGDLLDALWVVRNSVTQARYPLARTDPVDRPNTITMYSQAVDPNGRLEVEFYNPTNASVRIDPQDIYVLFRQGSFEWNYVRATLLILLQLAFLAAIGVLAGTFLSFPVAVLLCLVLLLFSLMRSFVASAVDISSITAPGVDFLTRVFYLIVRFMSFLLPDMASTWPSTTLVDGLRIGWDTLGQTAALVVGVRTLVYLALGCFIFHRRELARVQV